MWYNLAASDAQDAVMSETSSHMRDLVAAKMTPAQIAEAQKMARESGGRSEGRRRAQRIEARGAGK